MAPLDRAHITSISPTWYIQLYHVPFLSYLMLNNIVILKSGSEVTQGHLNCYHLKAGVGFPIRFP